MFNVAMSPSAKWAVSCVSIVPQAHVCRSICNVMGCIKVELKKSGAHLVVVNEVVPT